MVVDASQQGSGKSPSGAHCFSRGQDEEGELLRRYRERGHLRKRAVSVAFEYQGRHCRSRWSDRPLDRGWRSGNNLYAAEGFGHGSPREAALNTIPRLIQTPDREWRREDPFAQDDRSVLYTFA